MGNMLTCPTCNGTKHSSGFVPDPVTGRPRITADAPCAQCGGEGVLSEERAGWIRIGRGYRQERLARRESIVAAATRLGISVSVLVSVELGRVSPDVLRSVDAEICER